VGKVTQILKNPQIIIDAIRRSGLSQRKFANLIGIQSGGNSKMSLALQGKRGVPLMEMAAMCRILGLNLAAALEAYGMTAKDFVGPTLPDDARDHLMIAKEIAAKHGMDVQFKIIPGGKK
jgi:hypothetical protein